MYSDHIFFVSFILDAETNGGNKFFELKNGEMPL